jgi:hypothetical protein
MTYPYRFKPGVASGIGTGAERFALLPPSTTPVVDLARGNFSRYGVRKSFRPEHATSMHLEQQFVAVALRGNGLALQGQLDLQALSQLTQGKKK